jgi:hypothetical protein
MRSLHKNENLLFKDFQDFLVRSQQIPKKRIPFYLRLVTRFHEFCSRQHLDGMGKEAIVSYLQDMAMEHEDWQVQQAKEAVRPYRYFKGLPEATRTEQPHANGRMCCEQSNRKTARDFQFGVLMKRRILVKTFEVSYDTCLWEMVNGSGASQRGNLAEKIGIKRGYEISPERGRRDGFKR